MEEISDKMDLDPGAIPERYPFIVLRKERFGGFLFNRYLSFIELDPLQTRALELCAGHLTVAEITALISQEFQIQEPGATVRLASAFDLFEQNFALRWRERPRNGSYTIPSPVPYAPRELSVALVAPLYVLWDITYACNLRCQHCLTSSGVGTPKPMSLPEVCGIIDQLVDMGVLQIMFVGGEPFVRHDMLDILTYASQRPIGISVTTNGVLVDDRLIAQLKDLNLFDVQVSIDGLETTHDAFRGLPGTFRKATDAIRLLAQAGFRVTVNTVMTQLNRKELESLAEMAASLGAKTFKAINFLPVGRGRQHQNELMLTPSQMRENALRLRQLAARYQDRLTIVAEENYPLDDDGYDETACGISAGAMGCAAGLSQLVLGPDGQVFACPFLHDFPVGDLRHQSVEEIWRESAVLEMFRHIDKARLEGKCNTCRHAPHHCRGGCRAAAYAVTGNLWAADPLCWHGGRPASGRRKHPAEGQEQPPKSRTENRIAA